MAHKARWIAWLAWPLALVCVTPALAATVTVTDSATGRPLADAVVEVYASGTMPVERDAPAYEMMQRQTTFIPYVLAVPVGAAVEFPNRDTTRHQAYSFSPAHPFNLDLFLRETPPPEYFDKPGVVVVGCNIHDSMQAFIIVSEAPYFAKTGDDGTVSFDLPPGNHRLRIWHPKLEDTHYEWWEGELAGNTSRSVALTLNASLPAVEKPSALERRFQQALQQRQSN
ncbi:MULTISPECIES: hypothetical protein [Halomonadaceae]|uniref:Methylamine utilization protein n=1 Tax=Modicisalibacter zincidurans TaxID=1178777 RepID=A0ABP9RFP6_9GAMM|nr:MULTISPECIES: hypothetical protein [Halomonas]MCD6009172.1 Cupredoxin [Halomonas sp. IOP_31]